MEAGFFEKPPVDVLKLQSHFLRNYFTISTHGVHTVIGFLRQDVHGTVAVHDQPRTGRSPVVIPFMVPGKSDTMQFSVGQDFFTRFVPFVVPIDGRFSLVNALFKAVPIRKSMIFFELGKIFHVLALYPVILQSHFRGIQPCGIGHMGKHGAETEGIVILFAPEPPCRGKIGLRFHIIEQQIGNSGVVFKMVNSVLPHLGDDLVDLDSRDGAVVLKTHLEMGVGIRIL